MTWTWLDSWIAITAALAAVACALLGNFLVLRRLSMMGDAISHAVLPGLAIAFLITGSRANWAMFAGAAIVGVLTAAFTQWVHSLGKVDEGASMGVVFTALFAIGLILIVQAADAVDLDPGCVLYGAIELTPLDTVSLWGWQVPRAALVLGIVLLVNLFFITVLFKELRISSFDPALATTMGVPANLMHYLLMTLVAITTVAAFESVGSILVIAMLIVPAATAHLLTDRLHTMVVVSAVVAILAAVGGHLSAIHVPGWFGFSDTSTAGMIAVCGGLLFTVALLFAPRHGVLSRLCHQAVLSIRIVREDCLSLLYRLEESSMVAPTAVVPTLLGHALGANRIITRLAIWSLRVSRHVQRSGKRYTLTPPGRTAAADLLRSNRLWKEYLAKHFELPPDHRELPAERVEHFIGPQMEAQIQQDTVENGGAQTNVRG